MNTQRRLLTSALVVILTLAGTLTQASPNLMSYHGRLNDAAGEPVADGPYNVTFRIYDDAVGGTILWAELQSVTTLDGLFATQLGKTTPLAESVFSGDARWLGVQIETDPELSPRAQLTTAPYSHRVSTVDGAQAGAVTGDLTVDGEVNIIGPGVRFPDGTLQSSAASTFDPFENIFNNFTLFNTNVQTMTAFTAPPDKSIFITSIHIVVSGCNFLEIVIGSEVAMRLVPECINPPGIPVTIDWNSGGGAPLQIPPNVSLVMDRILLGSHNYSATFTGYQL